DRTVTGVQTCALPIFSQRSGIDLSNQQIQELAARRLEAILDPRGLKPELLDQLRRSAGERPSSAPAPAGAAQSYPFDEASLYDRSEERRVGKGGRTGE